MSKSNRIPAMCIGTEVHENFDGPVCTECREVIGAPDGCACMRGEFLLHDPAVQDAVQPRGEQYPFCSNQAHEGNGQILVAAWHHGRPPGSQWICEPCVQKLALNAQKLLAWGEAWRVFGLRGMGSLDSEALATMPDHNPPGYPGRNADD